MADLQVGSKLSAALEKMAASENLSVETLLNNLLGRYRSEKSSESVEKSPSNESWQGEALDNFIGMFDDDIDDLSTSVRESVTDAIRKKHARPG